MNLDELRSVQSKERQKDSLQNLRPSFYQEVGEYIADLEDERDRVAERADDPFSSPEVGRLTDEIETAKDVVEAIYERRMGKLVKQASLAAAGMPADDDGLTAEEADLFDDLVERISSNKSRVLDVLEGLDAGAETGGTENAASEAETGTETGPQESARPDSSPTTPDDDRPADGPIDPLDDAGLEGESGSPVGRETDDAPPVPPQETPTDGSATADTDAESDGSSGVTPADVMGGDGPDLEAADSVSESATVPADDTQPKPAAAESGSGVEAESEAVSTPDSAADDASDVDRVTVRITRDIGSILGVDDREYSLSSDDIVTLPEQNATPLVEQEAAEPLE